MIEVLVKTSEDTDYRRATAEELQQLIGSCMMNPKEIDTIYQCYVHNGALHIDIA